MSPLPTTSSNNVGAARSLSTGKRSRSSSVASDASETSIFSPTSSHSSPSSSNASDDEHRPCKTVRIEGSTAGFARSISVDSDDLNTLGKNCSLVTTASSDASATSDASTRKDSVSPSHPVDAGCGKTLLVDCLVDATVHVLDMVWHAPVRKAIAFLNDDLPKVAPNEFVRPCRCPVGVPLTQDSIPMDLFIRETLRRSRTSCSTLQAALLYCKRVGYEVVRKRVERESVELTEDEKKVLEGPKRSYASLARSLDAATETNLPQGMTGDPILCSRRTFLASIMVSSKFLQDRTFSNRAWSKISGLNVSEVGLVERRMLDAIEFDLSIASKEWQSWTAYLKGEWRDNLALCPCKNVFDERSVL